MSKTIRRSTKPPANSSRHHIGGHWRVVWQSVPTAKKNTARNALDVFKNPDDAMVFLMLSDCAFGRPKTRIEKVHTDVFKNSKVVQPFTSHAELESFEILMEPGALEELKRRTQEMMNGAEVSWDEIKNQL